MNSFRLEMGRNFSRLLAQRALELFAIVNFFPL
jgi:hypothetical protein